jgi:hypothetical protein
MWLRMLVSMAIIACLTSASSAEEAGVWLNGQPRRCPALSDYGSTTAVPKGCVLQLPSACLTLDEYKKALLRKEQLLKFKSDCTAKIKAVNTELFKFAQDQAQLKTLLEECDADNLACHSALSPPPNRLVWAGIGAGVTAGGLYLLYLVFLRPKG